MTTSDLATFLAARLDEDEEEARAASAGPWTAVEVDYLGYGVWWEIRGPGNDENRPYVVEAGGEGGGTRAAEDAAHIARWDPSRVLTEVAAKRRLIDAVFEYESIIDGEWGCCHGPAQIRSGKCSERPVDGIGALQILALPYADHPDYREEWRP